MKTSIQQDTFLTVSRPASTDTPSHNPFFQQLPIPCTLYTENTEHMFSGNYFSQEEPSLTETYQKINSRTYQQAPKSSSSPPQHKYDTPWYPCFSSQPYQQQMLAMITEEQRHDPDFSKNPDNFLNNFNSNDVNSFLEQYHNSEVNALSNQFSNGSINRLGNQCPNSSLNNFTNQRSDSRISECVNKSPYVGNNYSTTNKSNTIDVNFSNMNSESRDPFVFAVDMDNTNNRNTTSNLCGDLNLFQSNISSCDNYTDIPMKESLYTFADFMHFQAAMLSDPKQFAQLSSVNSDKDSNEDSGVSRSSSISTLDDEPFYDDLDRICTTNAGPDAQFAQDNNTSYCYSHDFDIKNDCYGSSFHEQDNVMDDTLKTPPPAQKHKTT